MILDQRLDSFHSYVSGRVLDSNGNPVKGALIELWHADREGDYLYSASATRNAACDVNFAGFGQYLTGSDGGYRFRTVKAGLYNGRTRHYHWGVTFPGEKKRTTTQTGWKEVCYDLNGKQWATQNSNDNVFSTVSNSAQLAAMLLSFTPILGATTHEQEATWDYVGGRSYSEPTYPSGGSLSVSGQSVSGPGGGNNRYKITVPGYIGYSYEVYGNPTFANLGWKALPFSLSQTGALDRSIQTVTSDGKIQLYLEQKSAKGFYYVSFRVPGANTGSP